MKIIASIVILLALAGGCDKPEKQVNTDKVSPNVVCQNISVILDGSGNATITPAMVNNASADNKTKKENLIFSLDKTTFNSSNIGNNPVILTVTDQSGNFSTCTATVSISAMAIAPSENDHRTLTWINPAKTWASYTTNNGFQIDDHHTGFRPLSTLPEPGYLARINNVPQAGQYTLSRGADPADAAKKAFFHKLNSAWDQFDGGGTSRSELDGGIESVDVFLEGQEYWYATAYYFDPDCFGHKGYSLDLSDIHEQNYSPETPGAVMGGVMNSLQLGDNRGSDSFVWSNQWITSYPPIVKGTGWGELIVPLQATADMVPNVWYYVIRKVKLHYDANQNPYSKAWVAKGNGSLVLKQDKTGPNAFNLDNPRYFPKSGLYKWDQTWGSKNTRTMWQKGMYIFKATAPTGNEPVIDQNSILLLLRSI